jgi:hypothetical protein
MITLTAGAVQKIKEDKLVAVSPAREFDNLQSFDKLGRLQATSRKVSDNQKLGPKKKTALKPAKKTNRPYSKVSEPSSSGLAGLFENGIKVSKSFQKTNNKNPKKGPAAAKRY